MESSPPAPERRICDLARRIDHTLLRPEATAAEIDALCSEALRHHFACVCVHGMWVPRCARILAGTDVKVCAVVGFPMGAMAPEVKAFEARRAIRDGASEIDMVLAIGALKSGQHELVRHDIDRVAAQCRANRVILKVILETALLTDMEKVRACEIAKAAGADFVKTSTGFSKSGATVADVGRIRAVVGPAMGIKAAGGIRDAQTALEMIQAGATRIGTSHSVEIVGGRPDDSGY
jgi:deoxyribose-phosphate aldolase